MKCAWSYQPRRNRITALEPFLIDVHQIYMGAGGFSRVRAEVAAMARLVEAGKIRSVGVSNFSARRMLTGKFRDDRGLLTNRPRTRRLINGLTAKRLDRTAPLIDGLREIANAHQASVSQVALAWLITYYGDTVVAIPGASKPHHADEAAGALKIKLSPAESARLAELSTTVNG